MTRTKWGVVMVVLRCVVWIGVVTQLVSSAVTRGAESAAHISATFAMLVWLEVTDGK